MQSHVITKSGMKIMLNTPEEEAAIAAGIAADPDTFEPTDAEFAAMRRMGRPKAAITKERITIRLSPDVLDAFRATGAGWQTRMDAALREWIEKRNAA